DMGPHEGLSGFAPSPVRSLAPVGEGE
ncbi:MAG: hypothetical protein RJA59_1521, partial [Pseudomonadota bacterium]